MTARDTFASVQDVTEARYLAEYRKIQPILAEEARLRGALTRLDDQARAARDVLMDQHAMQATGADIQWQAWVSRTRRQLNVELAQVLARKSAAMEGVRAAFGRREAVKAMFVRHCAEDARNRSRRFYETLNGFG